MKQDSSSPKTSAKRPAPVLAAGDPGEEISRQRAAASAARWKSIVIGAFGIIAIFVCLEILKPAPKPPAAEPPVPVVEPVPSLEEQKETQTF